MSAESGKKSGKKDKKAVKEEPKGASVPVTELGKPVDEAEFDVEALYKGEDFYRALIENALEVIIVLDGQGKIKYKSPSFVRMIGAGQKGKGAFDFVHPDDAAKAAALFTKLMEKPDAAIETEIRGIRKSGDIGWYRVNARNMLHNPAVEGIVVVFQDISERKQAEEAVEQTGEYFRSLIENAMDAIAIVDAEGNLSYMSPAVNRLVGRSIEEQMGVSPFGFIHEDDLPEMAEIFSDLIQTPGRTVFQEVRVWHDDGSLRYFEVVGRNMVDHPMVNGIVANMRDVTERRKAEMELEKYQQSLEQIVEERTAALKKTNEDLQLEIAERERAEEALRASEEKLSTMFSSIEDGIVVTDLESNIIEVNDGALRLYGADSREELIGKSGVELLSGKDRGIAKDTLGKPLEEAIPDRIIEFTFTTKDGTEREVEASTSLLYDRSGKPAGIISVAKDITERKRMQEELQRSEEKLRTIFESIGDALIVTDLTGTIIEANEAALKIGGYSSKDELIGRNSIELISPEDVARSAEYMAKAFKEGIHVTIEHRMVAKDGREFDVEAGGAMLRDVAGKPVGIVSIAKDITERKRMQEDLLLKESAVEHSINAIAMSDMDGNITYVNQACVEMWGVGGKKEDLLGKPYYSLLDVADEDVLQIAEAVVGSGAWEGELRAKRSDGSEAFVHVFTAIVNDDEGYPIQTISAFIDVTERKRIEDEIAEYTKQLEAMFNSGITPRQSIAARTTLEVD